MQDKIKEIMVLVDEYTKQAIDVYTDASPSRNGMNDAWLAIQSKLRELVREAQIDGYENGYLIDDTNISG